MKSPWTAIPASDESFVLGEGPVWDPPRSRLLWVDIAQGMVLEGVLAADRIQVTRRHEFSGFVGAVAVDVDGRLLVAAQSTVVASRDGAWVEVARIVPAGAARRINDAKCDPAGRFIVGTKAFSPSTSEELVRIRRDGSTQAIDSDLTLSNGLAWTHAGTRMYSVDTLARTVWVRDYDPSTGSHGTRREFVRIDDGYPDGMCSDAEDHLWIAIWGGSSVRRYSPDGMLVGVVLVDAPHTTSVAFAGTALDTLVITTATDELNAQELAAYPDSGRLFVARPGVIGAPVPPWNPAT